MAKKYQRRCCVSSHRPQIRWPKVFGRVESLDWRGLRDTSRSDRCLCMTLQRGNYDPAYARPATPTRCAPSSAGSRSSRGGLLAPVVATSLTTHRDRDIDVRKSFHSRAVEELERLPRSTTEKILPQPGYSRAAGSWALPHAQRPTICLTERLRDNFGDGKAGGQGKVVSQAFYGTAWWRWPPVSARKRIPQVFHGTPSQGAHLTILRLGSPFESTTSEVNSSGPIQHHPRRTIAERHFELLRRGGRHRPS